MNKETFNSLLSQKVYLEFLTVDSVSIKTQSTILLDGIEQNIGENHVKAYVNSLTDREILKRELEEPYLTSVLYVWGENPTVSDEPKEEIL